MYQFNIQSEFLYNIVEVYKIAPELDTVVRQFGSWDLNRDNRLQVDQTVIWERRRDMQG